MAEIRRRMNDSAAMRWSILLLVSFAMAVNYWFYDVLSPIQEDIIKNLGLEDDGIQLPELGSCEIRTGGDDLAREANAEKVERS